MTLYADALALVGHALRLFLSHSRDCVVVLSVAAVLAVGCWLAATHYSRLWNLHFRSTPIHHVLCALAAACTLVFAVFFASMGYTKQAADISIDTWSAELMRDQRWSDDTFEATYREIKALGLEDPSQLQQTWEQKRKIAISHHQSRKKFAEVHANAAVANFRAAHPFLSKILGPRADIPAELINEKVNAFLRTYPDRDFPAQDAINIAASNLKSGLQDKTDRVVWVARTSLVVLFVMVQLIPFSLIGYAAYRDVKVIT